MDMEEKTFPFELKALTEDGTFEGYAAIFDKPDAFGEVIAKGAFNKTLQEGKTRPMCWYHDPRNLLGIVDLAVDDKGLKVKGYLNLEVQSAKEKYALMKQKAIKGLSFGFKTIKDIWDGTTRIIKEIKLFEVSPVTFQAHPEALVTAVKQNVPWDEEKPFPNEHAARIKSPGLFDGATFRRKKDGTIYGSKKVPATAAVIWGKLKGAAKPSDNPIPQSLRFPTENWSVAQAKKWLKDNNVKYQTFEAASKSLEGAIEHLEEMKRGKVIAAQKMGLINDAVEALKALLKITEPRKSTPDEGKSPYSPILEALENEPEGADKPLMHLFGTKIKALEKSKTED